MSQANTLFEILKNHPEETIKWAKTEIKEYQKLIKLLEEQIKKNENS